MSHVYVGDGAEVRDRNALDGRIRKEEETHRHMSRLREGLELLERRVSLSALPRIEIGEASCQSANAIADTRACPAQQFGFYVDSVHAGTPPGSAAPATMLVPSPTLSSSLTSSYR